ncbi:MAG: secreted alkaline phosphatase [Labilithrix sp.]|nr:secreted alkaline phosphatase [Labilithrix sp.]
MQSGDVSASGAVVWCRSDRPARMMVEWSDSAAFTAPRRVLGPWAVPDTDLIAKVALEGLPSSTRIHYRVRFEAERASDWQVGALSTPDALSDSSRRTNPSDVVFAWSGDTNGQGWGIDTSRGGMPAFTALLDRAPDFFVSCGDAIYADNPIPAEIALPDGGAWKNLVTPAKSHIAETLDDFRGAHLYPRHSAEVRALSAQVPTFAIWDDHEVRNNWFPGEVVDDPARTEPRMSVIAEHAKRAMLEHWPTLVDPSRMYRSVRWGPMLEVFFLDGRSFRTPNHPVPPDEAFLGKAQLAWLEHALAASTATWKVIACDMPVGLVVSEPAPDRSGIEAFDGFANTNGPPSGRETELASLLSSLRRRAVRNVVWLTADVHYAAAHRYDPSRAAFRDMDPFWEFVAGPMHATSFPRKRFDDTFGPELAFATAGWDTFGSPATGQQYFGIVRIDGASRVMTVTLVDGRGRDLHVTVLRPSP